MGSALSCLGHGSGAATKEQVDGPEGVPEQCSKMGSGARHAPTVADGAPNNEAVPSKEPQPLPDSSPNKQAQPPPLTGKAALALCLGAIEGCGLRVDEDSPGLQQQLTGKPWNYKTLGAPNPPNNQERSDTADMLGLPPSPQCAELNLIMRTLCRVFEAPYACMALYYNRCCWITNSWEWPLGTISWKVAACPWNCLVTQPQVLACGELYEDARFHHQPWVDSGLRCYVSAPLLASNGHRMGTVCFLDTVPRRVDAGMCRVLSNFGEIAIRVLERHVELARRLAAAHQAVPHQLHTLVEAAYTGRDLRSVPGSDKLRGLDEGHWDQQGVADDAALSTTAGESAGPQPTAASPPPPLAPGAAAEPLPADVLLSSVFARQLRSSEVLKDACTLVVDTGVAGWTVMYADETWKLWSGYTRAELLGRPLQALLSPATPGVAPLNWAALQREVEGGQRFVVPGVVAFAAQALCSTQRQLQQQQFAQQQASKASLAPVAEGNAFARRSCQPAPEGWQSSDMAHDLDMPAPRMKDACTARQGTAPANSYAFALGGKAESHPVSDPGSMIDTQAQATPAPQSVEDLLSAVVQHESGSTFMLGREGHRGMSAAGCRPSSSGVEMWHEAAGAPPSTRSSTPCSTPAVSTSNITTATSTTARLSLASLPPHALPGGRVFDLSFRPLALDVLDEDALPLGIPSWVPLEACAPMLRLYAVRLHATMAAAQPPQPLTPSVKLTSVRNSTLQQLAGHLFPGLGMGQVLGRGGYGTAYTGTWHDVSVVVKVQDHQLDGMESLRTAQVEVALGQMLRHPHLVRTLGHGAAEVAPSATPAPTPSGPRSRSQAQTGTGTGTGTGGNGTDTSLTQTQSCTAKVPELPSHMPIHSGFSPLSKWLMDSEHDWDGYGANSWFSHCSQDDMARCTLVTSNRAPEPSSTIAQSVFDELPPPINFINAVAVAPDVAPLHAATNTHAPLPSTAEGTEVADGSAEPSGSTLAPDSSNNLTLTIIKPVDGKPTALKGNRRNDHATSEGRTEGSQSGPIHSAPAWDMGSIPNISYLPVMAAPAPLPAHKRGHTHVPPAAAHASPARHGAPRTTVATSAGKPVEAARLKQALAQVASHALGVSSTSGSSTAVTDSGAKSAPLFNSSKEVGGLSSKDLQEAIAARASANGGTGLGATLLGGAGGGGADEGGDRGVAFFAPSPGYSPPLPSSFLLGGGYMMARDRTDPPSSSTFAAIAAAGASSSSVGGRSSQSLSVEMSSMMDSAQRHATHVGAKPMQFPMHLRTFAILEFCDGGTLQDAVDRGWLRKGSIHIDSPIDLSKVVTLASHVACAAAYLHERGVVHADLSAANVLLCSKRPMVCSGQDSLLTSPGTNASSTTPGEPQSSTRPGSSTYWYRDAAGKPDDSTSTNALSTGEELLYTLPTKRYSLAPSKARSADEFEFVAKVSDFGKSCLLGPEGVIKAGGYATVTHMAPEVLREHLLSPAADVYALGVLMWQMYTGCRPWAGLSHRQILSTVLSGAVELEWPAEVAAGLPEEQREAATRLAALGRTCLAHEAAARPTMAAVESELNALAQQLAHMEASAAK